MVGRAEEELLATTFQAITHPEDLLLHEEKTALLLAGKIRNYSLESDTFVTMGKSSGYISRYRRSGGRGKRSGDASS